MRKLVVAVLVSICLSTFGESIWQDCRAWYSGLGGKCAQGKIPTGSMLDIRHAADGNASTHGGTIYCNGNAVSNVIQTVTSPTSGMVFENQCTTYLSQPEKIDAVDGKYKIYEGGVLAPFAVQTNMYTVLLRIKIDASQQTNATEHGFLDMGYNYAEGRSFNMRLTEAEQLQVCYNRASKKTLTVTNDVTRTMFGTWLELAVQMSNGTIRVGAMVPGLEKMSWLSFSGGFSSVEAQTPKNGWLYLGGYTHYANWSATANAARATYHMVAYWDRVLSDKEITEAFSWPRSMALVRVGGNNYGSEMFGGVTTGVVTDVSAALGSPQELPSFPAQLSAGKSLLFRFNVPVTATNLAQVLHVAAAATSASAALDCTLDGGSLGCLDLLPGKDSNLLVNRALMTEGVHELILRRTDGGAQAFCPDRIELSGSWRLGFDAADDSALGADRYAYAGAKPFYLTDLTTNRWKMVQSCSTKTRYMDLYVDVDAKDAAERRFVFRTRPYWAPGRAFDLVVQVNGIERFRTFWDKKNYPKMECKLAPGTLLPGRNVFRVLSDDNPDVGPVSESWMRYACFSLEAGRSPSGLMIIFR